MSLGVAFPIPPCPSPCSLEFLSSYLVFQVIVKIQCPYAFNYLGACFIPFIYLDMCYMALHVYYCTGLHRCYFLCKEVRDGRKRFKMNKRTRRIIRALTRHNDYPIHGNTLLCLPDLTSQREKLLSQLLGVAWSGDCLRLMTAALPKNRPSPQSTTLQKGSLRSGAVPGIGRHLLMTAFQPTFLLSPVQFPCLYPLVQSLR